MPEYREATVETAGIDVVVGTGGDGPDLLMLHDELGFPGWMRWNQELASDRTLVIPFQPGFGRTPRVEWFDGYRDVAAFYSRMLREQDLGPIDVVGFSAGGFIAAEMAAACPELFRRMILVAPMGVRPSRGEIFDFLAVTMRKHVALTVSHHEADEFSRIYGGEITPEQFELFEAARAETSRLGWEPFMFDPSLPERLEGVGDIPALLVWGEEDLIVPKGCIDVYEAALPDARVEVVPGVGHRPEIEDPERFTKVVSSFLAA